MQEQPLNEEELRQQQENELQKKLLLQKLLEPGARQRLARVRLANPELAIKVEYTIIYLYQAGQLKAKISEDQLKEILAKLTAKRETKITRK